MIRILVIEDDAKFNQIVCSQLRDASYEVVGCLSPREAYDELYDKNFDLIISDIMMPETDGFAFAEYIRTTDKKMPILFTTARDDFLSKQRGFQIGIDDYMVKPIDTNELLLRVKALLHRANIASEKRLTVGSLVMNEDEMTARVAGKEIKLTVREFNILYRLLSYLGKTFSRTALMDEFWGFNSDSGLRAVDVYMTKLRNKLKDCPDFTIVTVHSLGYKAVLS